MEHVCMLKSCAEKFESKRADAKYCSAKCRKADSRKPDVKTDHRMSSEVVVMDISKPAASDVYITRLLKYCDDNGITVQDLVDFHKLNKDHKCKPPSLRDVLSSDVKSKPTHNMTYIEQRQALKQGRAPSKDK